MNFTLDLFWVIKKYKEFSCRYFQEKSNFGPIIFRFNPIYRLLWLVKYNIA